MTKTKTLTRRADQIARTDFRPTFPLSVEEIAHILLDDLNINFHGRRDHLRYDILDRLRTNGRTYAFDTISMFLWRRGMDGVDSIQSRARTHNAHWAYYLTDTEYQEAVTAAEQYVTETLCGETNQ